VIMQAIRDFARMHGRPPMRNDWRVAGEHPNASIVARRFGSWAEALIAAGFTPNRISWEREQIATAMREYARQHGHPPTTLAWKQRDRAGRWPAAATVIKRFGSWSAALQAARLPLSVQSTRPRSWKPETVLEALRDFTALHERPPNTVELAPAHGLPSAGTVTRHFGSVERAYAAAGLDPPPSPNPASDWDQASSTAALAAFTREHGRPPVYNEWQRAGPDHPGGATVKRLFGSWTEALIAARVAKRNPVWDRQSIILAMRAWTTKHGRSPSRKDWKTSDPTASRPIYATVVGRFESWPAALQAAGVLPARLRQWDHDEAIEALRAFTNEHGRPPTSTEWHVKSAKHPGPDAIKRMFGSWPEALIAAGVAKRKPVWDRQRVLAAISTWTTKHGRLPTQKDWKASDPTGRWPTYEMVVRHCGSWLAALRAAPANSQDARRAPG